MEKQLSVAVLGCGRMGHTIIMEIKDMPEVKRVVGYDPNEKQLEATKKVYPNVEVTSDLDALLADEDIKLVYIAANNVNHVPLAVKALRAGKAVMTEKPSGVDREQIDELQRVQEETGGFLQVGLECRYSHAYKYVKDTIVSGEIGDVKNIHFTYSMPPYGEHLELRNGEKVPNWRIKKETGGSMYFEKLCHYIDLVRWWNEGSRVDKFMIGSAENVIPYFEIEDNAHVSYHFDNGCVSHLYFNMTAAPGHNNDLLGKDDLFDQDKQGHKLNYVISGTEGAIEVDIFQRQVRVYHHPGKPGQIGESIKRTLSWDKIDGGNYAKGETEHIYFHNTLEQNQDIVRRVLAGDKPSITIQDAQETMRLCLDFTEAAKNKAWEVVYR